MATKNLYDAPGVNFTPGVYQGEAYQYQGPDMAIAERSMANLETRMNKANEAYSNMIVDLSKLKSQMHQDEITQGWLKEYEKEKSDEINNLIQEGNYGRALRTATQTAANIYNDNDIQNRIRDNIKLEKQKETLSTLLNNGKLDKMSYDYLIYQNEKEYMDRFDTTTGAYKENAANNEVFFTQAVESINFDKEIELSFELISPTVRGYQSSETSIVNDSAGNPRQIDTNKGGWSYRQVTSKQIIDNLKERFGNVNIYESLVQEFEAKKHHLDEINDKLKTTTDEFEKNILIQQKQKYTKELQEGGSYVDVDTYLERMIQRNKNVFKNRALYERQDSVVNSEKPIGQHSSTTGTPKLDLLPYKNGDTNPTATAQVKVDMSNAGKSFSSNAMNANTFVKEHSEDTTDNSSQNNNSNSGTTISSARKVKQ